MVDTVAGMDRFRPFTVSGLAVLTLVIWGNRIWLAWTNDEDTVAEKLVWSVPITVFVVVAVVLVAAAVRGRPLTVGWGRSLVAGLAWGTIVYWAVRAPMITLADHPAAFKVVHAVLALVSVAASAAALRSLRAGARAGGPVDPVRAVTRPT